MAKINLICEKCGGSVELDDSREFGYCIYCKAKILIKNDTIINTTTQNITKHVYGHQGKDVDELVADGNKLLELGNNENANVKFIQAIDIEPTSWEAWFGYAATGGDRTEHISCVPAYKKAYEIAVDENQEIATFKSMTNYLPDGNLAQAFIKAYESATHQKRHEMFDLVVGVIGRDETEVADLAVDLCPDDWSVWFAQAKIRQIRVRWCELEGFFVSRLPEHAIDVLNIFMRAYELACKHSEEAKKVVLAHISSMVKDNSYYVFANQLNAQIKQKG